MDKKYILLSLEDERIKAVADMLNNKTAKKIIDFLSETREASENDISTELKIPLNTVEYNIRKMVKAGLAEEAKGFFWSRKGKKIKMYRLSNKSIIISPKKTIKISNEVKQILPIAIVSGFGAMGIKYWIDSNLSQAAQLSQEKAADTVLFAAEATTQAVEQATGIFGTGTYAGWFIGGVMFITIMFLLKMILFEKMWEANKN